ncbi:hypothetical protein, partial [Borreliella bavariensis]|uniref:hypothetical protein n=1 Tax=Borreliella bavariensis TaxID=664662 RepID=UPI001CB72FC5
MACIHNIIYKPFFQLSTITIWFFNLFYTIRSSGGAGALKKKKTHNLSLGVLSKNNTRFILIHEFTICMGNLLYLS